MTDEEPKTHAAAVDAQHLMRRTPRRRLRFPCAVSPDDLLQGKLARLDVCFLSDVVT